MNAQAADEMVQPQPNFKDCLLKIMQGNGTRLAQNIQRASKINPVWYFTWKGHQLLQEMREYASPLMPVKSRKTSKDALNTSSHKNRALLGLLIHLLNRRSVPYYLLTVV